MKNISLLAAIILIAGCSNSTDTTSSEFPWTIPGINSMFIYHEQLFDTTGLRVIDEYDTSLVIASGFESNGKADCVETQKNPNSFFPPVFGLSSYGSNGDWSIYGSGGSPGYKGGWLTFHLGSRESSSWLYYDSTYESNGHTVHASLTDSTIYIGEDTIIEAGEKFDAFEFNYSRYNQDGQIQFSGTEWIAPSVGINIMVVDTFAQPGNYGIVRNQTDLVAYKLY